MKSKLQIKNIDFSYEKNKSMFNDFSLSIENVDEVAGAVTALVGKSGSGKSTLLKLLAGIELPKKGLINFYPQDLNVCYLPQFPVLFEHFSIYENATYLLNLPQNRSRTSLSNLNKFSKILNLENLLKSKKSISELSGGEKQRLALLQVVSIEPDILLMDEPCTGLDSITKRTFLMSLKSLVKKIGINIIYVTHHIDEAKIIADKMVYLGKSKTGVVDVVANDSMENLIQSPQHIEVAQFLKYPFFNVLDFSLDSNKEINNIFDSNEYCDSSKIGIDGNNIRYSINSGVEFVIVDSIDGCYRLQLQVDGEPIILVSQKPSGRYIDIKGSSYFQMPGRKLILPI